MTVISSNSLLSYYSAKLSMSLARSSSTSASSRSSSSASSTSQAPWSSSSTESTTARDAEVLSMTDYVDTSNVPASAVGTSGKLQQDNQKLFSIYNSLDTLSYLAQMASRTDTPSGVIDGYNTRFQECLSQIEKYISTTTFNNLELQQAAVSAVATATATIASASYDYTGNTIATSENINQAVSGISTTDSFSLSVKKNGTSSDITISMADVAASYGTLTMGNIISYINDQLKADGYSTRFKRVETGTKTDDKDNTTYSYGMGITYATGETVTLSATSNSEALYLSGTSGLTTTTTNSTTGKSTAANSTGRVVKLSLDTDTSTSSTTTTSVFSSNQTADSGTTTATKSVTGSDGNSYVIGTATGNMNGEANQSSSDQDVYITKYDSAGKILWSHLLGSSGTASGYDLALDSANGGVVVVGSTTANLTSSGVINGKSGTFVAKFDEDGDESWVTQISTGSSNSATSVSVDTSGNITVGGTITGKVSSSATRSGGADAYLMTLSSKGVISSTTQYGSSDTDTVSATTYDDDGNLYVASVENGEAYIRKYTATSGGTVDITGAATWTQNLGSVSGGAISDIGVDSTGNVYVAGNVNSSSSLNKDSSTTVSGSLSGNNDAFVYKISQASDGSSSSLSTLTYVGTSGKETAGTLAISSSGTVYLAGTTTGTFSGQSRTTKDANNAFVTAIDSSTGSVSWTKQYGGTSGSSTGASVSLVTTNSSVLDTLGLPTGTVQTESYANKLSDGTTAKTGDTVKIKISTGSSTRTVTITLSKTDTLNSLVLKINNKIGDAGEAAVKYSSDGRTLKLTASSGYALTLEASDSDSDLLKAFGLSEQTLSDGTVQTSTTADTKKTYGLGLSSTMKFSSKTEAKAVKAQISNVLSALKNVYSAINSTSSSSSSSTSSSSSSSVGTYSNLHQVDASVALSLLA